MSSRIQMASRRQFLRNAAFGTAVFTTPGLFAEQLARTPRVAEGPFYPDKLPLDTDNDLLIINDALTPAVGQVSHLHGTVRDIKGNLLRNALVEIWQVDGKGVYLHSDAPKEDQDRNFQGYGRFSTDAQGRYYFRTVKPVAYPGRTPHIHLAVSQKGKRMLTTQCYIQGEPRNGKDFLYKRLGAERQKLVTLPFEELEGSRTAELQARWDLVVGVTPEDRRR
mgnify:CR=1 FL=1